MSITLITSNHLNQLKELAKNLSDDQLSEPLNVLDNSTIGAHVRHVLEFYLCLFDCVHLKHLNYDDRKRDKKVETSTEKCVLVIERLLNALNTYQTDFELTLSADYSTDFTDQAVSVQTTFFRELLYNIEHLVHHLAIIKIGMQTLELEETISDDFGISSSTIRNRKVCVQ
ncbi:DinB family protein [Formosa sp. PL04]|uniref:DinB family protein n=1 Tax=Formosa sp. PL04 TaxID=3081755 RepID=UPI00298117A8|nr:DinB family protein [Formosa sp. PL04]MDW5290166.1 DinB family protein [Formosa sp. PL04]